MEGANARGVVYVAKNSVMFKERIVESCEWVWGSCDTKGKEPAGAPGIPVSEGPHVLFTGQSGHIRGNIASYRSFDTSPRRE